MTPLLDRFRSLARGIPILVYAVQTKDGVLFYIVYFRNASHELVDGIYNALTEEYPNVDIEFLHFTPEDWECVTLPETSVYVCGRENVGKQV